MAYDNAEQTAGRSILGPALRLLGLAIRACWLKRTESARIALHGLRYSLTCAWVTAMIGWGAFLGLASFIFVYWLGK